MHWCSWLPCSSAWTLKLTLRPELVWFLLFLVPRYVQFDHCAQPGHSQSLAHISKRQDFFFSNRVPISPTYPVWAHVFLGHALGCRCPNLPFYEFLLSCLSQISMIFSSWRLPRSDAWFKKSRSCLLKSCTRPRKPSGGENHGNLAKARKQELINFWNHAPALLELLELILGFKASCLGQILSSKPTGCFFGLSA